MRVTFTPAIPQQALANKDVHASFVRNMTEGLHSAIDPMMQTVEGQTPSSIVQHYSVQDVVSGNSVGIRVENDSPIYNFWDKDTRPHTILPRTASVLAFPVGGRTVFARAVHHPGTKGHHVFDTALNQSRSNIDRAVQNALYAWLLDSLPSAGGSA
jgi:hypothetical protein